MPVSDRHAIRKSPQSASMNVQPGDPVGGLDPYAGVRPIIAG